MSGDFYTGASTYEPRTGSFDAEISPHLQELASKIKNSGVGSDELDTTFGWSALDRVIAFAASAEQHIAEQQMRIRELENMSTTDELTGLANRRGLKNYMQKVLSSAKRYNETGVIGFLDLNDFKKINDTYGHDAGDIVLKKLSKLLEANLRDTDFVARLGGDEFVFILEKADTTCGLKRAAEIRDIINATDVKLKRATIRLSSSMGLAIYDKNSTYDDLINSADKAMYEDKKFNTLVHQAN
ncbi:GGDEF domain-containing protein [Sneathiella limimaris]|uniref:GGDEF domain-containing protein n=1 Tax=Sneathiella limimaris TaxID=1964213 RepID=UPI00146C3094|nr:GGDEF domain-containing protein [Sneathiella limimaris]